MRTKQNMLKWIKLAGSVINNKIILEMNPENIGQHIKLKHSSLWRRPFSYQKPVLASESCHKQLNQMAASGVSWRTRNNFIFTRTDRFKNRLSISFKSNSKDLESLLSVSDKQSNMKRSAVKSLRPDAGVIDRSVALVDGMKKIEKIGLLTGKEFHQTKFPGIIKYAHIYNDYHERVANPGFSRNYLGKIYTK